MRKKLRQKIEKELEVIFEPIFSYEDTEIASYYPLEKILQWKMDTWCAHITNKFRQLSKYFRDCNLPFVSMETFTKLSLIHTMEHEVIHCVDDLDEVNEQHMQYITNKFFTERLIQEILLTTYNRITKKLPQIKMKERRHTIEPMLNERNV